MNKVNYQKELEKILANPENRGKHLFLHSCCAPCSSYVLTYLSTFFKITVFYYNPNITDNAEYRLRVEEQKRLIETLNSEAMKDYPEWSYGIASEDKPSRFPIEAIDGDYDLEAYYNAVKGYENEPEGGARCAICFRMRLIKTLEEAIKNGADYFATTLTISPMKNADLINSIGISLANSDNNTAGIKWLMSDFKKKEGYKHSIELSGKYNLYRQNFCGCEFSKEET